MHYTLIQAKSNFETAERSDFFVSPTLYFYGLVALSKIIILKKNKIIPREVLHGLTVRVAGEKSVDWNKNYDPRVETVLIKEKGLFPTFYKSISRFALPEGEKYTLGELFTYLNRKTSLDPLAVHYLILFLLSMLSRYEPQKWGWAYENSVFSKELKSYLKNVGKDVYDLWIEKIRS
ncbi:MAG TPA: YaaC family protein [Dictyoglomaceae bacterium]|nr:YaaC family protein [Dictyoglomaceae bacterium]HOL38887.1 YaaC family protein [Dictyoglomaceae bacterium]HOP94925.1 YaaC family protein [Dictyoglomaceae bacterium]HPP15696.1 YaaC family protein [Dictyoglomaceae bacterium]HPU43535.1 YaaC family protein [Dictyoglomaceae bacterium]